MKSEKIKKLSESMLGLHWDADQRKTRKRMPALQRVGA